MARPTGRKTTTGGTGAGLNRGSGTGHGKMGGSPFSGGGSSSGGPTRSGGSGGGFKLIIALIVLLLGGGGGLTSLLLGGSDSLNTTESTSSYQESTGTTGNILGSGTGWDMESNSGKLIKTVSSEAREKRTVIKGDGSDKMTVMVYLCGTDLESRSKMATSDLQEMLSAQSSDSVNIVVYTGGCKGWQNSVISSSVNQIYQVKNGSLSLLESDMGSSAMTDPNNLTTFIKYASQKFPANRYELIMWDHGGGSLSGYGYDEKFPNAGGMDLSEISSALKDSGVTFDFIGFDACLMATVETAIMLDPYADYMIASEETEPGIGWYYTDWLNEAAKNPGIDTLTLGKTIVDSFNEQCAARVPSQSTTLSVIDLSEFSRTVPDKLNAFASSTASKIDSEGYKDVTTARGETREFAASSKIDQIDLCHFTHKVDTAEAKALQAALLNAVKYNRVSRKMTNSYGVSAYFPYRGSKNKTSAMAGINDAIGLSSYNRCITAYNDYQSGGQSVYDSAFGSSFSLANALFSGTSSSGSTGSVAGSAVSLLGQQALSSLLSGALSDRAVTYIEENQIDASHFVFTDDMKLLITDADWELITDSVIVAVADDGNGYLVLGEDTPDTAFVFDENGYLNASQDKTWLSINGQTVSYTQVSYTENEDGVYAEGYVPCTLNDEYGYLLISFDPENVRGEVTGFIREYNLSETENIAKVDEVPHEGDVIQFLSDGYDYNKNFTDVYKIGAPVTVEGGDFFLITNEEIRDADVYLMYKFTDIYGNTYYTESYRVN